MSFAEAGNDGWTLSDDLSAVYQTGELAPGETEEIKVILNWNNSEDNLGLQSAVTEVLSVENEAGFEDVVVDDDSSSANLIIGIETGDGTYVVIMGVVLIVLLSAMMVVFVRRKRD
jgi:hypothetical protein